MCTTQTFPRKSHLLGKGGHVLPSFPQGPHPWASKQGSGPWLYSTPSQSCAEPGLHEQRDTWPLVACFTGPSSTPWLRRECPGGPPWPMATEHFLQIAEHSTAQLSCTPGLCILEGFFQLLKLGAMLKSLNSLPFLSHRSPHSCGIWEILSSCVLLWPIISPQWGFRQEVTTCYSVATSTSWGVTTDSAEGNLSPAQKGDNMYTSLAGGTQ